MVTTRHVSSDIRRRPASPRKGFRVVAWINTLGLAFEPSDVKMCLILRAGGSFVGTIGSTSRTGGADDRGRVDDKRDSTYLDPPCGGHKTGETETDGMKVDEQLIQVKEGSRDNWVKRCA